MLTIVHACLIIIMFLYLFDSRNYSSHIYHYKSIASIIICPSPPVFSVRREEQKEDRL